MATATKSRTNKSDAAPSSAPSESPLTEPSLLPVELIAIDRVQEHLANHRLPSKIDEAEIAKLAESIRQAGRILQPILVYRSVGGDWRRVFGYRRTEAARRLGWKTIPAAVLPSIPSDAEVHYYRAIENLRRKNLTPAEEALAVHELAEAHSSLSGRSAAIGLAARELGEDPKWVTDRLYIVDRLSPKVRDELAAGRLNFAQARELAKVGDAKAQEDFCRTVTYDFSRGVIMSVEKVHNLIDQAKHSLRQVQWDVNVPFAGKPACSGCPHNTATDVTLFDTSREEAEKGCCMSPGCYDVKLRKVGAELEKLREKAKKLSKQVTSLPDVKKTIAPEFVKASAVDRVVKQAVGSTPAAAKKAGEGKQEKEKVKPKTEKERRQEALLAWGQAFSNWRNDSGDRIEGACNKHPGCLLLLPYLYELRVLDKAPDFIIATGEHQFDPKYGRFSNATKPPEEKPVPPAVASLLNLVKAAVNTPLPEPWMAFLGVEKRAASINFHNESPEMVRRWCDVFGVEFVEPPRFEDFLPEDLRPKQATGKAEKHAPQEKPFYAPGRPVKIISSGLIGMSTEVLADGRVHVTECVNGHAGFFEPDKLTRPTKAEITAYEKSLESGLNANDEEEE